MINHVYTVTVCMHKNIPALIKDWSLYSLQKKKKKKCYKFTFLCNFNNINEKLVA